MIIKETEKHNLKRDPSEELLSQISAILIKKGFKSTTMDLVANTLSISKRTLYETFDNKDEMLLAALDFLHQKHRRKMKEIFESAQNVMEALFNLCEYQIESMTNININFFRDMDKRFRPHREKYIEREKIDNREIMKVFRLGIRQGVFRTDSNYPIMLRMFRVQMESLKRMEEIFSNEFTCEDVLRTISIGFLRSIASPKGMVILDSLWNERIKTIKAGCIADSTDNQTPLNESSNK